MTPPDSTTQATLERVSAFKKIMTDFPRAWDVCKNAAPKESHHEKCSWRTHGLLCDCVGDKTFIYCIDTFVEPYKCIASLVEAQAKEIQELKDQNTMMREWFEIFQMKKTPAIFPVLLRDIATNVLSSLSK